MKFYSNQLSKVAESLSAGQIKSVLFYGPDHGLIEHSIKLLSKMLKLQRRNNSFTDISGSDINSLLNNASLFAEKELISVKDIPSNPNASLKELFAKEHHNILVLGAGELSPSSPLRKMFESEQSLAAIACYNDNEATIAQIIKHYLTKYNKRMAPEAIAFLKENLHGDRFIIVNELEKLFTYASSMDSIGLDDVLKVISNSSIGEADKLCLYFLNKNGKGYFSELERLLSNNISSIWIIRALVRYYINASIALKKMSEGANIEAATSNLPSQIFFKYKPDFIKAIKGMQYADSIKALEVLYRAEKSVKSGHLGDKEICLESYFTCHS